MALDGVFLSHIVREINSKLEAARVDKVQQPEKDEIIITFRLRSGTEKLLLSASSNNPRIHFSKITKENPITAPMFCMLLRKHLTGSRFAGARQTGLERIVFLDFDCRNEFGDEVLRTLAVEIMGRRSNIILSDENGKILDAVKHVDFTMSSKRQVLPGLQYQLPPSQDKLDLLQSSPEQIVDHLLAAKDGELQKCLLNTVQGISPVICREIAFLSAKSADVKISELKQEQVERLKFFVSRILSDIKNGSGKPAMLSESKTNKPFDFAFMDITQYGVAALTKTYAGFSLLLEDYYYKRDLEEHMSQRSQDILKIITNASERVSRKLANRLADLDQCAGREKFKIYGDLISANLYQIEKGSICCELENFYREDMPVIKIALDPSLSPAKNAQKYYREYHKLSVAEKYHNEQILSDRRELVYLDSVFEELSRAETENELNEIRNELADEGYMRKRSANKGRLAKQVKPLQFKSDDGFTIYVGRNNKQNDHLTLKTASKNDIWFHTKNIPGAHVIILTGGEEVPDSTLTQAAILAASHSRAKESRQVPVDYTLVRNVKKPSGAKPGMVIYENYKTAYANPNEEIVKKLQI